MYALEVERVPSSGNFRALLWDLDEDEDLGNVCLEIIEAETLRGAVRFLLSLHRDKVITHSKRGNRIEAPDEISVLECCEAMLEPR